MVTIVGTTGATPISGVTCTKGVVATMDRQPLKAGDVITLTAPEYTSGVVHANYIVRRTNFLTGAMTDVSLASGVSEYVVAQVDYQHSLTIFSRFQQGKNSAVGSTVSIGAVTNNTPPVNTVPPVITSDNGVVLGCTLSCTTGTWTGATDGDKFVYTYQWYRSGALITGATNNTYKTVAADNNATLKCRVIVSIFGYAGYWAESNEIGPIDGSIVVISPPVLGLRTAPPSNSKVSMPIVNRIPSLETSGTWLNVAPGRTYEIFVGGVSIGSTNRYLTDADIGKKVFYRVTATSSFDPPGKEIS